MSTVGPRTSDTHRSRIARRLDRETGMGYQPALNLVRDKADSLLEHLWLPRLDDAACDVILRLLMQQSLEWWGPGIAAHRWHESYRQLAIGTLPMDFGPATLDAWAACRERTEQAEPCGTFDPGWLAAQGVEPLSADAPDWDEDEEEESQELHPEDIVDEPDRWKRLVLFTGPRTAFRMPSWQSLPVGRAQELEGLGVEERRAHLAAACAGEPWCVEAQVLLGELERQAAENLRGRAAKDALAGVRARFEVAVAVGECSLHFFRGTLLWREDCNRPFLRALYGLADVAAREQRWNAAELVLFTLLSLNPYDEQDAAGLLSRVRRAVGIPAPLAASR